MKEWARLVTVFIVVILYNYYNKALFNINNDLSLLNVIITLVIAMIVYTGLEFFIRRKHKK